MGVIAVAAVCALAGCSVEGTPTRGPVELKTGKYGDMRAEPAGEATSEADWARLRAVRLAESMIFVHELDAVMDDPKMPTQPLASARNVQAVLPDTADLPVMKDFQYGFTVSAGNGAKNDTGINHAVFVFVDAKASAAAADQLSDSLIKDREYSKYERVRVPGMPTQAVTVHDKGRDSDTVAAFTPVGERLIYTWADAPNRSWPDRIVKAAYDQQKRLLDSISPGSDDRRIDPDGLLTGTVDVDDGNPLSGSVYGQRAAALFYRDQSAAYAELKKAGIEQFAANGTQAYEAASNQQAQGWREFLVGSFRDDTSRKAPSPQDLDTATCAVKDDGAGCFIVVGPYVGEAYGPNLQDAQERISAQYRFLTDLDS